MNKIVTTSLGIAAVAIFTTIPATAQVTIIGENFDGSSLSTPSATYNIGYYFGDITSTSVGLVSGAGTGGSGAFQCVNTSASLIDYYAGAGYNISDGSATGNTSANLSDYTLSFDANATGGSLEVQLQSWTQSGFAGTQTLLSTAPQPPGYGNDLGLTPGYTHYSLNLGDTGVFQGNTGFAPNGQSLQITFQYNTGGILGSQTLNIDNLSLTMVPEPCTFALAGLGAAALLIFRRRTSSQLSPH